jgi:putative membrane protein
MTNHYCGPAPTPNSLALSWNLDPVLIAGLLGVALLYIRGARRLERGSTRLAGWEKAAFHSGWLITALAVVSPLCPLSVSLFAARAGTR